MLDFLKPSVFPEEKVIAGVTKRNLALYPETGMSFAPAGILSLSEIEKHIGYFSEYIGIKRENIKLNHQVHETEIRIVGKDYVAKDADGMICNEAGILLVVKIADCCCVMIYDPVQQAVAALHSGWRGTYKNIVRHGIEGMKQHFGSLPGDLLVFLSPSASGERYEVGWDVARYFPESAKQLNDEKFLFDNKRELYGQLLSCGVSPQNIEVSDICTISDTNYHSYRRDGQKSGRMAAFIGLKHI